MQGEGLSAGDALLALCAAAGSELLLVAPYVKEPALAAILAVVPATTAVRVVTRWRPDEIAAGVSDLSIWPLLRGRPGSSLWLHPSLHAKLYCSGAGCLVGSANLTGRALGWCRSPNLELLLGVPSASPEVLAVQSQLGAEAVRVDDSLYVAVERASERFALTHPPDGHRLEQVGPSQDTTARDQQDSDAVWLPLLRNPEHLYRAYSGHADDLTAAGREAARRDMAVLSPPSGLDPSDFRDYVGALLLQHALIRRVDELVVTPQRFGAVRDLIAASPLRPSSGPSATTQWQTLMRWLLHFLPDRYVHTVPRHSEVFARR